MRVWLCVPVRRAGRFRLPPEEVANEFFPMFTSRCHLFCSNFVEQFGTLFSLAYSSSQLPSYAFLPGHVASQDFISTNVLSEVEKSALIDLEPLPRMWDSKKVRSWHFATARSMTVRPSRAWQIHQRSFAASPMMWASTSKTGRCATRASFQAFDCLETDQSTSRSRDAHGNASESRCCRRTGHP